VLWQDTSVSEDHAASIFNGPRKSWYPTTALNEVTTQKSLTSNVGQIYIITSNFVCLAIVVVVDVVITLKNKYLFEMVSIYVPILHTQTKFAHLSVSCLSAALAI
jgi:hypothetical protein